MKDLASEFWEVGGKSAVVLTFGIQSLGYIGLVEVNDIITILISLSGLCYMVFRAFNEYTKFKENKAKEKPKPRKRTP